MASETDETNFAGLARFHHGFDCATVREDTVQVFQANDLMELRQIDVIGTVIRESTA